MVVVEQQVLQKHTEESIETCGAEVQKGNPPTERKIQRLLEIQK